MRVLPLKVWLTPATQLLVSTLETVEPSTTRASALACLHPLATSSEPEMSTDRLYHVTVPLVTEFPQDT
jgi:hypothetical protein